MNTSNQQKVGTCCSEAITPAKWKVIALAGTNDGVDPRSMLDAVLTFWTSSAILTESRRDIAASVRTSINYALSIGKSNNAACRTISVVLLTGHGVYWGHSGPGCIWSLTCDGHWRRLTDSSKNWREGYEPCGSLDCLIAAPLTSDYLPEGRIRKRVERTLDSPDKNMRAFKAADTTIYSISVKSSLDNATFQKDARKSMALSQGSGTSDPEKPPYHKERPDPYECDESRKSTPRSGDGRLSGPAERIMKGLRSLITRVRH